MTEEVEDHGMLVNGDDLGMEVKELSEIPRG
jgi:hypothetical protein